MMPLSKRPRKQPVTGWKPQIGYLFIYYFGQVAQLLGSWFPNQGLNPCPQQWKCKFLTTGLPGNSQKGLFIRGRGWGNPETNQSPDVFKYIGILQVWGEEKNKS